MSSIKGIIFDYGGTIDTNGIHWGELIWEEYQAAGAGVDRESFREAYVYGERSLAKTPIIEPSDTFRTLLSKKMKLQAGYLRDLPGTELRAGIEEEIAQRCYDKVLDTLACTRAVVDTLSVHYPMVLVTNFYGNMPVVLKEFALDSCFKSIVESSVVGLRKPDPALFALGVKSLGYKPEEIAVIGDSYRKDIYPASVLGCRTIWIKKVCWAEEPVEKGHEPSAITDTLEKVPEIIGKL
jgi:putative hydrolase of the HAD superfamily